MQNRIKRYYDFAGMIVSLTCPEFEEWNQLAKFKTEEQTADVEYDITVRNPMECPEGKLIYTKSGYEIYLKGDYRIRILRDSQTGDIKMMDTVCDANRHQVFISDPDDEAWKGPQIMRILDIPRQIILHGGIFLHSSFILKDGKVILFSGDKKVGKSTQANLWSEFKEAEIVNGDRAILRKNGDQWYAYGSPYSGTSKFCIRKEGPIEAIVILSKGQENDVQQASVTEAFKSLLANCTYEVWDKEQLNRALPIMEQVAYDVNFVKLSCLPDRTAADTLEEFLCQIQK